MIRVTVEVVPFGVEQNAHTVGTVYIANDGTGDRDLGNYSVWLDVDPRGNRASNVHDTRMAGFRRFKRADGYLACVERALYKLRRGERE